MSSKTNSVIVTIRHGEVADPEEVLQELRQKGFRYEPKDKDSIYDLTQVAGEFDGDPRERVRPGGSCDIDGWKSP